MSELKCAGRQTQPPHGEFSDAVCEQNAWKPSSARELRVTGLSSAGAAKRVALKRVGKVRLKRNKTSSNPKEWSMYNNNNNVETGEAKPNFLNLQSRYSTNSQLIPKLEITTSPVYNTSTRALQVYLECMKTCSPSSATSALHAPALKWWTVTPVVL